jgi:YcaO cyclodehydratase, ATP-ad Mg2+-binding
MMKIDCVEPSLHLVRDCSVIGARQLLFLEAQVNAADLTGAAALLESVDADASVSAWDAGRAAAVLNFLGLLRPSGEISLTHVRQRQFARLFRMSARLDAVFPMWLPTASGAAFFGARRTHGGGAGSVLAGEGLPKRTDYAGLGLTLAEAFCSCVGEAAEHDAMFLRRQDNRLSIERTLPLLDARMRETGRIDATLVLRDAGEGGRPPPRSSTGYAAGPTLEEAALSALLECVERHAVSLWFNGARQPAAFAADDQLTRYFFALRGAEAPQVRLMRLPHDVKGAVVAAAFSISAERGVAVGYGCAMSAPQAAMKAARELCQGEFALYLEAQSDRSESAPFAARSELFAERPGLFETRPDKHETVGSARTLASLCAGFAHEVQFVNLTVSENAVPVVCALVDGIQDIAGEIGPGQTGPL